MSQIVKILYQILFMFSHTVPWGDFTVTLRCRMFDLQISIMFK